MLRIRALVLLFFTPFLTHCQPVTFEEQPPANLFREFKSYQTINEVDLLINAKGLKKKILEDTSLSPEDKRPAFSMFTIEIENFEAAKFKGKIKLLFLNKRLYSIIVFSKDDITLHGEADENIMKKLHKEGQCTDIRKHVKACRYNEYFSFEDKRIIKYIDYWVSKWS